MFQSFFHAVVYDPLYNTLVFLLNLFPHADLGLAVIALTLIVRIILFPLFSKTIVTQAKLKQIEPELKKLKEKYKKDRQKQAQEIMALYKREKISPFAGIATLFIQIPIFLALYFILLRSGFPEINTELLYSFVSAPAEASLLFLGFVDLSSRHIVLALLAGITQYIQIRLSPLGVMKARSKNPDFKEDFTRSMQMQMKYGLPVIVAGVAYFLSGAIALYWIANNVFGIFQELFVRKRLEAKVAEPTLADTPSAPVETDAKQNT